jgi:hypothetical protein
MAKRETTEQRVVHMLDHSGRKITETPVQEEIKHFLLSVSVGRFKLTQEKIVRRERFEETSKVKGNRRNGTLVKTVTVLVLLFLIALQFFSVPKMTADKLAATMWSIVLSVR